MRPTVITPTEFARQMKASRASGICAVAVSGGADSMALALLTHGWTKNAVALTVDHGIRKASAQEAKQVARWLKARGIEHHILKIKTKIPTSNRQALAREARYVLLTEWCRAHGVNDLLLAHQQDDQAETFLMRMHRGSGIDGLACMTAISERNGVRLLRPLLHVPKARLIATLEKMKQPWIEDPSNHNEDYTRTRIRRLMPTLAKVGLAPGMLSALAAGFASMRRALEKETDEAWRRFVHLDSAGCAILDLRALAALDEEIALRLLAEIYQKIGEHQYRPRFESLTRLYHAIQVPSFSSQTLGGCLFKRSRKKKESHLLTVMPEPGRMKTAC